MQDVRLVVNISKNGSNLKIINLKVVIEDREEGTQLSSLRSLDDEFTNTTALFSAIQTTAIEVFNSTLNN